MQWNIRQKKWNPAIFNTVDEPWGHHAKWNKSEKDKYYLISLICGIQNIALIKTEIEWWLPGAKGCIKCEDSGQRVETCTYKMNKFKEGFPSGTSGKEPSCQCRRSKIQRAWSLTQEDKETATHFSILAWRIPWTEEPGRLWSIGSQRVRHDWSNLARTHASSRDSNEQHGDYS